MTTSGSLVPVRDFPVGNLGGRARAWLSGAGAPPVTPKPAATVLLVRDAESVVGGVEVFMLRRVASMEFAPSTWVFPGGGVDPRDDEPDLPWAGPAPAAWAAELGCSEGMARALVAAAVREVFEECGVLLAGPTPQTVVADLRDPEWDRERAALLAREQSLAEMLVRRSLVLRSDLLSARGRWVTPEFEPRRYDTWFFAALLPPGQIPDDDTTEADHADWTSPTALLTDHHAGRALMLPPTVVSVEEVAAADSAESFVRRPSPGAVVPVAPVLVETDGGVVIRCAIP